MHRIRILAVATGLAVALAALAPASRAQGPAAPGGMPGVTPGMMGMGMGMGGGQSNPLMILLAPSVQKELKLTDEQKNKIYTFAKAANQKNRDLMQTMAFGGNANPQAMMEAAMQLRQETDRGIAQILEPKQKERFDQIVLQAEGPLAVARPEIAAKLKLNDAQQDYVQGVMMQMRRELFVSMRQGAANGPFDPAQRRAMVDQLRQDAVREITKVIDRKQQAAFNKMLGEPFDIMKLNAETTTADATLATAPADTAKTADTPQEKEKEKDATDTDTGSSKDSSPPARKKGRTRSGGNP